MIWWIWDSLSKLGSCLVHHADVFTHHYEIETATIRKYMDEAWAFLLCHTLREGNTCADFLAKLGIWCTSELLTILDPPAELRLLLMADNMGVSYSRGH